MDVKVQINFEYYNSRTGKVEQVFITRFRKLFKPKKKKLRKRNKVFEIQDY